MPERPLLILPTPGRPPKPRKKQGRPGRAIRKPSPERQVERLQRKWRSVERAFQRLQTDSAGIVPEEALVLETVGSVSDFLIAVRRTDGMEWLGELEVEDIPPDDDFYLDGDEERAKPLPRRLYLVMSSQAALRDVLSLWRLWQDGAKLPYGQTKWRDLFSQLREVRRWGVKDRLPESVREDWLDRIEHGQERIPCQIELWYRAVDAVRDAARERVMDLVEGQGGQVLDQALIRDIAYDAVLAELPSSSVQPLLDDLEADVALVRYAGV